MLYFYRLLKRLRQEGGDSSSAALREEAHATETRGQAAIAGCDHPATGLGARRGPDVGGQGRAHHAEMNGVGGTHGRLKWHTGENAGNAVDLFLDDQACAIDKCLVPVIPVRPTQHVTKVAIGKGADRAGGIHLGVRSRRP